MANHLLEAALEYARQGWGVFPCNAQKEPLVPGGVTAATTNIAQLEQWWARWPRANIGFEPVSAHMMVLDLDPGHDKAALSEAVGGLPATHLWAKTPRGGEHLYYAIADDEIIGGNVNRLSPHVDVRSFHSYVLLAPSRTADGEYAWEERGKPAYRTDKMVELSNTARAKSGDRDNWLIEPDLPENVADAIAWLKNDAKIAVEGVNGDHMAYATAAHLHSYGISQETAFELMWEHWNPRCKPPWSGDEVEHLEQKIEHAYERYCTSPPGNITKAYQTAKAAKMFKPVLRPEVASPGRQEISGRFRVIDWEKMNYIPRPQWLIEGMLLEDTYAMLVAEPESFKSFVALDLAMSVAVGCPVDTAFSPIQSGPVLFIAGEGRGHAWPRTRAWAQRHNAGDAIPNFYLSDPVPNVAEDWDEFFEAIMKMSPDGYKLVVIDTVARAMSGANENAQEHASKFTSLVDSIRTYSGATVLAVHHSGHGDKSRGKGSMEFIGAPDTILGLERPDPNGLTAYLSMIKQKDAAKWEKPKTLSLEVMHVPAYGIQPACDSLAVVPAVRMDVIEAAKAAIEKSTIERKRGTKAPGTPRDAATLALYDNAIYKALSENQMMNFSHRKLADVLVKDENVKIGSEAMRQLLPKLKDNKEFYAHHAYDAIKGVWHWYKPS